MIWRLADWPSCRRRPSCSRGATRFRPGGAAAWLAACRPLFFTPRRLGIGAGGLRQRPAHPRAELLLTWLTAPCVGGRHTGREPGPRHPLPALPEAVTMAARDIELGPMTPDTYRRTRRPDANVSDLTAAPASTWEYATYPAVVETSWCPSSS